MVRRNDPSEQTPEIPMIEPPPSLKAMEDFIVKLARPVLSFPASPPEGAETGGEQTLIDGSIEHQLMRRVGQRVADTPPCVFEAAVQSAVATASALEHCRDRSARVVTFKHPHGMYTAVLIDVVYPLKGRTFHRTWTVVADTERWVAAFGPQGQTITDQSGYWEERRMAAEHGFCA